ncbi:DUF4382 domain-containing protein [Kaarinaea lacus]
MLLSVLVLYACNNEITQGTGTLTLSITDAPVDSAENVFVEFTGVVIQPAEGERIDIDFTEPMTIDLLALQNGLRATLLNRLDLDTGNYSWIRLKVNAEADGVMDSFIRIDGADYELYVPSGSNTGLKINTNFHVGNDQLLDYTIDFDLRKSVHQPNGQIGPSGEPVYFLRPTLRLVETDISGAISGLVDPLIFEEMTCSDPELGYGVYLYEGDVNPDDIDGIDPDPVSTATVTLNASSEYVYTLSYLMPGNYTIAVTCTADLDEPDVDNAIVFVGDTMVSVATGVTTPHDFVPAAP